MSDEYIEPSTVAVSSPERLSLNEILAPIDEPLKQVESLLLEATRSPVSSITEIASHLLTAGGKRLRPALTLLCAQATSKITPRAVLFAAVVELMHTATLMHDDVIDGASLRRGRPTANRLWGNSTTVMCGDYLYAKAFSMLAEDGDIEVIRLFAEASARTCAGEMLELQNSYRPDLTQEEYEEIAQLKTAHLISAACKSGSMAAGGSPTLAALLGGYGLHVGLAFQIIDDLLDVAGEQARMGKPVGSDLLEGKLTLPVIHSLEEASPIERQRFAAAFSRRNLTPDLIQWVLSLVRCNGGIAYTMSVARRYVNLALKHLHSLPPAHNNSARHTLELISQFVIQRRF